MDTIERIVRIEVLLPTLVTKEDLARATRVFVAVSSALVATTYFIATHH